MKNGYKYIFNTAMISIILLILSMPIYKSAIDVTPDMVANRLVIGVSGNLTVGNPVTIEVTTGGKPVEGVSISIDPNIRSLDRWTNSTGKLIYTFTRNGTYIITATQIGYEKITKTINITGYLEYKLYIKCLDRPLITHNLVLLIDSSGSTSLVDISTGNSFIELIQANAIDVIENMTSYNSIGIVSFGGYIMSISDILPTGDEYNAELLKNFIDDIVPEGGSPDDLSSGLLAAEELLNSTNGTKDIIVISDSVIGIQPDIYNRTLSIAMNLKYKGVNITYVQVDLSNIDHKNGEANRLYVKLANSSSDTSLILLNQEERISDVLNISHGDQIIERKCISKYGKGLLIATMSKEGKPIEDVIIGTDDGKIVTKTDKAGMINYFGPVGLYNITATKIGYEKTIQIVEILPDQTPIGTISPRPTYVETVIHEEKVNKGIPGFEIIFGILSILLLYISKR